MDLIDRFKRISIDADDATFFAGWGLTMNDVTIINKYWTAFCQTEMNIAFHTKEAHRAFVIGFAQAKSDRKLK